MTHLRWIVGGALLAFFVFILVGDAELVLSMVFRQKRSSLVLLVGGKKALGL